MTAPLKTVETSKHAALDCAETAARAKKCRARARARAHGTKDSALAAMCGGHSRPEAQILPPNAEDIGEAKAAGARLRRFSTALRSRREERRAMAARSTSYAGSRSGRRGTERWTRQKRNDHRNACACPIGGRGHHLREPPERPAAPPNFDKGRQCGGFCRRLGKFRSNQGSLTPLVDRRPCSKASLAEAAIALVPIATAPRVGDASGTRRRDRHHRARAAARAWFRARAEAMARVPVFAHLEGVATFYVDKADK